MKYSPYKIILVICDFILIRLSFFSAIRLRGVSSPEGVPWTFNVNSPEFFLFFILSFLIVILFQSRELYKLNIVLSRSRQLVAILFSISYAVIGLTVVVFFFQSARIIDSRLFVAYFAMISFFSIAVFRLLIFTPIYRTLNKNALTPKRVIIIGSDIAAKSFAVEMKIGNIYGFQLVGFIDKNFEIGRKIYEDFLVIGNIDDIPDIVKNENIHEIIVAEAGVSYDELLKVIDICKSTSAHVNIASPLFEIVHQKFSVDSYFDLPIAPLKSVADSNQVWFYKRILDIIGALVGIVLLFIPFIIIGVIIKFTSPGPIFYRHIRIGKDGKPFNFYKFRSMKVGSDQDQNRIDNVKEFIKKGTNDKNGSKKIINEDLITPIGRLLRKSSLDELPQFFNVLKGEMSLVGPRPCLPYEYEAYDDWHKRRLSVLPGCTGLWQVYGRSETGFDEMVVLDLYYIGNISPILDIQLMLKTVPVMIFGRGAK